NIYTAHTVIARHAGGIRGGLLRGKWSALTGAAKTERARTLPRQHVATHIRNRDNRVVERSLHVHQSVGDVLALFLLERLLLAFFLGRRGAACCYGFCHKFSFQWPVASCQFVSACAKVGVTATDHWQLATTP